MAPDARERSTQACRHAGGLVSTTQASRHHNAILRGTKTSSPCHPSPDRQFAARQKRSAARRTLRLPGRHTGTKTPSRRASSTRGSPETLDISQPDRILTSLKTPMRRSGSIVPRCRCKPLTAPALAAAEACRARAQMVPVHANVARCGLSHQ